MRLKALLVDDEIHLLHNLQLVIPWEQHNIEIVALARNGKQALEEAKKHRPDIVISDIRMPLMDGIKLLEELRRLEISSDVIMITGYQDFEYARSVIKHGARDYILKPIDYEELERTVARLAMEIRSRNMKRAMDEKKWNRVVHLAYEKMLLDVLLDLPASGVNELLDGGEQSTERVSFSLMLADIDEYAAKSRLWSEDERKLWNFAIGNVLHDALMETGLRYAVLRPREGEWAIVIERDEDSGSAGNVTNGTAASSLGSHAGLNGDAPGMMRLAAKMQLDVLQFVKLPVSFAVLPHDVTLSELAAGYKRLQRCLYLSPYTDLAVVMSEQSTAAADSGERLWRSVEGIVSGLKRRHREDISRCMVELSDHLLLVSGQSFVRAEQMLHFVVVHLLREMREVDMINAEQELAVWGKLEKSAGMKGLLRLIADTVEDGLRVVTNKRTGEQFMLEARDYIERHLEDNLGIEELADRLGISYSYFSMLFKQHFGVTFVEYVTGRRMERAKSLLLHPDKSVTHIGKTVGIPQRRYFTKVFLKHVGLSPSEYREQQGIKSTNAKGELE
ncbi:MAG: response regulator [Paenibacillus sp.]|nr:response regulator [Paenibacillus sp.]